MTEAKRTPWLPVFIHPVRLGPYEYKGPLLAGIQMLTWDGERWTGATGETWEPCDGDSWRGLENDGR